MALHVLGVLVVQRHREVAHQFLGQVRIFRHVRIQHLLEQADLVVRQQHRELRPGQPEPARLAFGQLGFGRQVLHLAIQRTLGLQRADEVRHRTDPAHRLMLHQGDRLVLPVVVPQHQLADLVGHRGKLGVARVEAQLAALHGIVEQDLDVHLVIGGVHAGGVVDEVGVEQHAMLRRLDAAFLGHAQVAALAHDLAAQVGTVDAQRVVGAVADIGMRLGGRLHVGADAAVPQQVDRRLQDRAEQIARRQLLRHRPSGPARRVLPARSGSTWRCADTRRHRRRSATCRSHPNSNAARVNMRWRSANVRAASGFGSRNTWR